MKIRKAISIGLGIIKTIITEPEAPKVLQEARKLICRPCSYSINKNKKCSLCGCNLTIKRKYEKYKCPDDPAKW